MNPDMKCKTCGFQTNPNWFFCPNCAKMLKEKAPSLTAGKQAIIYLVSFFLAPFGLAWGIKYIRFHDKKTQIVGAVSIALTIIAIGLSIGVFKYAMDQYATMLNSLTNPYAY